MPKLNNSSTPRDLKIVEHKRKIYFEVLVCRKWQRRDNSACSEVHVVARPQVKATGGGGVGAGAAASITCIFVLRPAASNVRVRFSSYFLGS